MHKIFIVDHVRSFDVSCAMQFWKYRGTDTMGDSALQEMPINVDTLEGQRESSVLLTGNISGSLRYLWIVLLSDAFALVVSKEFNLER